MEFFLPASVPWGAFGGEIECFPPKAPSAKELHFLKMKKMGFQKKRRKSNTISDSLDFGCGLSNGACNALLHV